MKRGLWTLIWMVAVTIIGSAQNTYYLPQIADGTQSASVFWETGIAITNPAAPGTPAATGTITFTKDNGTPFNVTFGALPDGQTVGSGNTIPFQLSGGQTTYLGSTGLEALTVGFATVSSSLPLTVNSVFTLYSGDVNHQGGGNNVKGPDIVAEAAVAAAVPLTRQAVFAIEELQGHVDTGVAIANPGTTTANITFQLLDLNGVATGAPVTTTLAAKNHTAQFVSQLFPAVKDSFLGTMQITSQVPLVSVGLLFHGNGTFSTGPVIPLTGPQ